MTAAECNAKIREAAKQVLTAIYLNGYVSPQFHSVMVLSAALALVPSPPTLAERIAAPTLPAEVGRAREILDAKDQGWNEALEAARDLALACVADAIHDACGQEIHMDPLRERIDRNLRSLLIPTVPPTKETK